MIACFYVKRLECLSGRYRFDLESNLTENNDAGGMSQRAEEFLQVFKKGAEFTQGLLKENERLRYRLLEVEQQLRSVEPSSELQLLKDRLVQAVKEKNEILERISSIEQESLDYANRYAEIEAENNLLANLYITTYQLHSTFDVTEIVRIVEEILLNLVGAEQFSLLLRDADGGMLQPLLSESGTSNLLEVEVLDPRILSVLADGQSWIATDDELAKLESADVKAVIPLQVDDEVHGVVAVYRLLEQKNGFTQTDREIFSLLGGHAAMALCTAVLRKENDGKVRFRQGFSTES